MNAWAARHVVQFYDSEQFLAARVADFLAEGIRCGQPAIVIATPLHRRAFAAELKIRGIDVDSLFSNDLVWLDARETLSAFMEGKRPNAELFAATVGNVFEKLIAPRRYVTVRAYGEMVDLVWRDGNSNGALALEELWNGLAKKYAFALLCAYAKDSLDPADQDGIERICASHTHVHHSHPAA